MILSGYGKPLSAFARKARLTLALRAQLLFKNQKFAACKLFKTAQFSSYLPT